jgi:two-component sensor histidine kinase
MRFGEKADDSFVFPFGGATSKLHAAVFIRHRHASLAVAVGLYAATVLVFGNALAGYGNYLVLLPVMSAALGFGTLGGLVAGILALPANLLLFGILGHPEYSPASKFLAHISVIAAGLLFGRLTDYFKVIQKERQKRMATEESLRRALAAKELLLGELHHRVKNNLNVVKSLIQLQRNRSKDPAFLEAADELIGRIFAIAFAHDELDNDLDIPAVDPARYIQTLVGNLVSYFGVGDSLIGRSLDTRGRLIPMETAISLGLIVNEVLTAALKQAIPLREDRPSIRLSLVVVGEEYRLTICDEESDPGFGLVPDEASGGLARKLVHALARNLGGAASLGAIEEGPHPAGGRFELVFPCRTANADIYERSVSRPCTKDISSRRGH